MSKTFVVFNWKKITVALTVLYLFVNGVKLGQKVEKFSRNLCKFKYLKKDDCHQNIEGQIKFKCSSQLPLDYKS